jgi:dienelactone hydrolase
MPESPIDTAAMSADEAAYPRAERVIFRSGDHAGACDCVGHLHLPRGAVRPPVILMGNGLATEWHFGTRDFVRAFTAAGLATFNFDYRHFGESAGEPRQLVDFGKQLDDWRAALACLRARPDIDATRLALWGSSLGGGHAISLAAEESALSAVVAQVPHLDGREAMKAVPLGQVLATLGHAMRDKLGAAFGRAPHTIPVLAEPGEIGLLGKPGWKAHYLGMVPPSSQWRNAIPARSIFTAGNYNPIDVAAQLKMPVLLVYGRRDAGVTAATVEAAAQRMANAMLLPFDGDHFEVYAGPLHDDIVAQETAFLVALLSR